MKIVQLRAEGFKRLVAVDISPNSDVVEVRGNNGEGKSSVLDAIFSALDSTSSPIKPVRTGEEYAIIKLDLGDLKVTRFFDEKGTTIKVENADGATYNRPETMLKSLFSGLAFDPLAFAKMKPEEQAAELRRLVPLEVDLDALKKADDADILKRREINRDAKALQPRIAAIEVSGIVPEKPDRDAILSALSTAGETNADIEAERQRRRTLENALTEDEAWRQRATGKALELRGQADRLDREIAEHKESSDNIRIKLEAEAPIADPVDTAKLSADLAQADRDLALLARIAEKQRLQSEFDELRKSSEGITAAIQSRASERVAALATAEMPVDGLRLSRLCDIVPGEEGDDLIVVYNGEPFSQASGAQQLRVSMRLAMAANPKLRVLLIKDGSLLDKNGWALIREMAAENDMQCWVEAVGDEGTGIIMEEGKVRGADLPEPMEAPTKRRKRMAEAEGAQQNETDGAADRGDRVIIDDPHDGGPAGKTLFERMSDLAAKGGAAVVESSPGVEARAGNNDLIPTPPIDKPATLYEGRDGLGRTAPRERRQPRAMTAFTSKPAGDLLGDGDA